MLDGLLSTKFHHPVPVGYRTERPRLDARLNESLLAGCRLAVVTAPAGFGKSTLVSAWVVKQPAPFAWLSLDISDNEPRLFLSYLVGALQKIDLSLGAYQINQINQIQAADLEHNETIYQEVMAGLVNEITVLPEPFFLVLDDCHVIKNPLLHRLLAFLIEHQPQQMRLILLTREDLPLPISRWRMRRQLVEIRQAEMQFTPEEALDYLQNSMGVMLSKEDGAALQSRTEGWIAGLQLAALSIRSSPDPARFVRSFTGSDRFILDYLLDEVYSRLPGELQNFLLCTSILERFCEPLCDAIRAVEAGSKAAGAGASVGEERSEPSSLALLDQIEHANLFLIPLGNDASRAGELTWYRYHHLFADLLRHRLHIETDARVIGCLHQAASRWYEDQDLLREAARHAFQVPDRSYATTFIERQGFHLVERSEVPLVYEWFRQLTENEISSSPWLCVIHAWALVLDNRTDYRALVLARLALAEQGLVQGRGPGTSNSVPGHIATIRAHLVFSETVFDPQRVIALSQQALAILPENDGTARSVNILQISYGLKSLSDGAGALLALDQAEPYARQGSNYYGLVCCYFDRARIAHLQGKLRRAAELSQHGKESLPEQVPHIDQFLPAFHSLDIELGCIYLEWNQLETAEQHLLHGIQRAVGMNQYDVIAYPALARLRMIQGNLSGMQETLAKLAHLWPDLTELCEATELLVSLQQRRDDAGLAARAAHWVQDHHPNDLVPGFGLTTRDEPLHLIYLAWIQMQILLGLPAEALPVIERMLSVAEKNQMNHRVIELCAMQALALQALHESDPAMKALARALRLAEPEGYIRTFDLGPEMQALLVHAGQQGICPQYAGQILRSLQPARPVAVEAEIGPPKMPQANQELVEPLSAREREVLRLLADGLSKAEIARRLYLSPNTLKAHTQNIYEKMGVHNRMEAVNRARELGIF